MTKWSIGDIIQLDSSDMVSHVVGSSPHKPPPGSSSWKDFWENMATGWDWPETCRIFECRNYANVGAHIYVTNEDQNNFILPTCQSCNRWARSGYPRTISVKHNAVAAWVDRHPNT